MRHRPGSTLGQHYWGQVGLSISSLALPQDHSRMPNYRQSICFKYVRPLFTQMCQFSGTVLQARQNKTLRNKQELIWAAIFSIHVLDWRELKSVSALSKLSWPLLHKCSPSLHLDDLYCPVQSLEGEQSMVLAFYAGAQSAHVSQI